MTLDARTVQYTHGSEPVFEGVSLSVSSGEVVGIIGPSGVGKSTLLRLLALFDAPTQGSITYENEDVWQLSEHKRLEYRRRIGMVFQEASLFDASVRHNVTYGLRIRQSWRKRLRDELSRIIGQPDETSEATRALETVGLGEKTTQDVSSLSGGERQRVAFARALAYEPEFLLLDEPTSDLDPRNTAVIEDAVLEAKERGIGVVIATHDMHQAERITDRVAVFLGTERIEVGDTDTIFSDPTDDRTQKFIEGELLY